VEDSSFSVNLDLALNLGVSFWARCGILYHRNMHAALPHHLRSSHLLCVLRLELLVSIVILDHQFFYFHIVVAIFFYKRCL